jgi:hypothetical protein
MQPFNNQSGLKDDDFYAEYLGKLSQKPSEYVFDHRFVAGCPVDTMPATAACKGFYVGGRTIEGDTNLRSTATRLNNIEDKSLQTSLYGTAPYMVAPGSASVSRIDAESSVRERLLTNSDPQRVATEKTFDRFDFVDFPLGVEEFVKGGRPTRFDNAMVLNKPH